LNETRNDLTSTYLIAINSYATCSDADGE
jgi:hypothetical protein